MSSYITSPIKGERSRTYHFPGHHAITINEVTTLTVGETSHRLETAHGKKYVVPRTFILIEIDAEEWSA